MDLINNLKLLCSAAGVGGLTQAAEVAKGLLSEYCSQVKIDKLGNVIGIIKSGRKDAPY